MIVAGRRVEVPEDKMELRKGEESLPCILYPSRLFELFYHAHLFFHKSYIDNFLKSWYIQ
jgi:hypothetical protein